MRTRPSDDGRTFHDSASPITPVQHPEIIHDFYSATQVKALFDVVRNHAPWKLVLAHHFSSTEEYLAVSGATDVTGDGLKLSDFTAPSFRGYLAEEALVYYPEVSDLYFDKQLLEPIKQMHKAEYGMASHMLFNVTMPSNSYDAGHFDTAAFRGMSLVNTPIWLLSVMHKSGLFTDWKIKTGQMITYFYDGIDGGFTYWPDGPNGEPKRFVPPFDNTCMLSDNSTMYHRRESGGPVDQRDHPDLQMHSLLHHEGAGEWSIRNDDKEIAHYTDSDLRWLFHYTAQVFGDLAEVRKYLDHTDDLTLERVVDMLVADVRDRGIAVTEPNDPLQDKEFTALLTKAYAMAPATYPPEAPVAASRVTAA